MEDENNKKYLFHFISTRGWLLLRLHFAGIYPDRRGLDALPPRYGSFAL